MTEFFFTLLRMSLAGGLTCILVFAAMRFTRKRIPAAWQFSIWLVAVLRLTVPLSADLPIDFPQGFSYPSVFFDRQTGNATLNESANEAMFETSPALGENSIAKTGVQQATPGVGDPMINVFGAIWLLGVFLMLGWCIVGYIVTIWKLKQKRVVFAAGKVKVYESSHVTTPILVGLLRPCIYLPEDFPNQELAIRHEMCHLRRGDIWMKWLVQIVVCLHWFNPLVYLMRYEMNRLAELACDQKVTKDMSEDGRRAYGGMLIDTARTVSKNRGMLFALSDEKKFLGDRIKALMTHKPRSKRTIVLVSILVICILSAAVILGSIFLGSGSKGRVDNIDKPFVDDPDVIGTWMTVDFVKEISDFDPSGRVSPTGTFYPFADGLYLKGLSFFDGGESSLPLSTWTKGYVLNQGMQTASKYEIREIDGTEYLFFEWKSGDYTIRGKKPSYYVMKLSSETPLTLTEEGIITEEVDLPFVDDPDVIGSWKSVDFVTDIEKFDPNNTVPENQLFLLELTYADDGDVLSRYRGDKEPIGSPLITWTKGCIQDKSRMVSSKYLIKRIDDADYLFYEWKNGDYIVRHIMPGYYVLKRE